MIHEMFTLAEQKALLLSQAARHLDEAQNLEELDKAVHRARQTWHGLIGALDRMTGLSQAERARIGQFAEAAGDVLLANHRPRLSDQDIDLLIRLCRKGAEILLGGGSLADLRTRAISAWNRSGRLLGEDMARWMAAERPLKFPRTFPAADAA